MSDTWFFRTILVIGATVAGLTGTELMTYAFLAFLAFNGYWMARA